MDENNLDPDVVALAKAVKQVESSGDIHAQGASGEYGAYQWLPATWDAQSKAAGVNVPLKEATNAQQNQVWYTWAKSMKDKGYGPAQIASMQNAGEGAPDAYQQNYEGTNKEGVSYNTPKYVQEVMNNYRQFKGQAAPASTSVFASENQPATTPTDTTGGISADALNPSQGVSADALSGGSGNPFASYEQQSQQAAPSESDSSKVGLLPNLNDIGSQLANNIASRFQQGSQALGMTAQGGLQGDLGKAASGVLQTAGAVAGGIGDVVNAGLQLIPGVEKAEQGVGSIAKMAAETEPGQKAVQAIQSFAQAHPEISGDLAAAANIASVIPMFKGISLIGDAAQQAALSPIKSSLEDAAANEMRSTVTPKIAESIANAEKRGLDPMGQLTSDPHLLPSVVESQTGRYIYDGRPAFTRLKSSIANDENTLQSMLNTGNKSVLVPIADARQQMLKDIVKNIPEQQLRAKAAVAANKAFDEFEAGEAMGLGRTQVGIEELNQMKRTIGSDINWNSFGSKAGTIKRALYNSLQTQVENYAKKAGVQGVHELNQQMGEKIEALNVLKNITGKQVKQSGIGKVIREVGADIAGAGGELAGGHVGIPYASTLAGRGLYRVLPGRVPLTPVRLLGKRTGSLGSLVGRGLAKSGTAQALRGTVNQAQAQ